MEIYIKIKELLIGELSFDLFVFGVVLLLTLSMVTYAVDDLFRNRFAKSINYLQNIYGETVKQLIIIICVSIFIVVIDDIAETNILQSTKQYAFAFFVILSFITCANVFINERMNNQLKYIYSLRNINKDNCSNKGNIKNRNELDCNSALMHTNAIIKCLMLKLDYLKHFIGPSILFSLVGYLNILEASKEIKVVLNDISIIVFFIMIFMFWKNYKELKSNYVIRGVYKSALYRIKNEIPYTKKELNKMRGQLYNRGDISFFFKRKE